MKLKFSLLFVIISALTITLSCNREDTAEEKTSINKRIGTSAAYNIIYDDEARDLEVSVDKDGSVYTTYFTYSDTKNDVTFFSLEYSFDNSKEGWKYFEQKKALEFAEKLRDVNMSEEELRILELMLDQSYQDLVHEVIDKNLDMTSYSGISYLKSAVGANLRAIAAHSTVIEGTLSPTFLVDRTFFMFQEDLKVNIAPLKENVELLESEMSKYNFASDLNLLNFIRNTDREQITYDEFYSFYVPADDFHDFVEGATVAMNAGDCSGWCPIGCGSDWGCCGNYTGCCVYSSGACLAHDLACTECTPAWFCLSGCKPDHGNNRPVKFLMSAI
ncbi:hypothetical protein AAEO56_00125 [Flavobacterium sp. DGU11]|uniref:Bacteriocin fulvocin C-related protein n=1 Tax=Flavobacterium arundinis TaxID=3139143 RepID=A0ABU9HSE4_9FLAO